MSAPGTSPPPGGDQNRAGPLIAIYWAEMFVAITIVSLRMYARYMTKNIGADDWLIVVTLVCFCKYCISVFWLQFQFFQVTLAAFVTHYALIGGTRHLYYLTPPEIEQVLKWSYIFQCWGIFACTPTKASIALLINRIMRPFRGWRFWLIVVVITLLAIINTLDSIFTYVQCNPAAALWDKSITNAKCWNPSIQANFSIFQACK